MQVMHKQGEACNSELKFFFNR